MARAGQRIAGRYRLLRHLGKGGQGSVWLAADERLDDMQVALKCALRDSTPGEARHIEREARALAKVNHPNVVSVSDVVQDHGEDDEPDEVADTWVVMQYVPGDRTLADVGQVSPADAARYGAQLAGALTAAHAAGVLHRDVKPSNVLLAEDDFLVLADFGISRVEHDADTIVASGQFTGTPGYIAPEYVRTGEFSEKCDIFALGATLFRLVEGTSPYGTGSAETLTTRTREGGRVPARNAGPLDPILTQMLDDDPNRRPSLEVCRTALASLAGDTRIGAARPKRRTPVIAAAAVAVLLVGAGLTWWAAADDGTDQDTAKPAGGSARSGTGSGVSMIGEATTADPCALLDPDVLTDFGEPTLDPAADIFNSCHLRLEEPAGTEIEVDVEIFRGGPAPSGEVTTVGPISIAADDDNSEQECGVDLHLPDDVHQVSIDAEREEDGEAELCEVTDTVAEHAATVLNAGQLPRRTAQADPASLINLSACDLIDRKTLEVIPGVDAENPTKSFAEWDCTWESTTGEDELRVLFQRSDPPDDGRPLTLSGHQAYDEGDSWGEDTCLVSVVGSVPVDQEGRVELVRVVLSTDDAERRCADARKVAAKAAAGMP